MFSLPAWMLKDTDEGLKLPSWARVISHPYSETGKVSIVIEADTEGYLEEWLELLKVEKIDQYWLECAYQCAKLDLQKALCDTKYDPRTSGRPAEFHMTNAPDYALHKHPPGKGIELATRGRHAREHYKRIRGALPF